MKLLKPVPPETIRIAIRDNQKNETRFHVVEYFHWSRDALNEWMEGNPACDCNRAFFFRRAGGEPDGVKAACGNFRYSLLYAERANGERMEMESGKK